MSTRKKLNIEIVEIPEINLTSPSKLMTPKNNKSSLFKGSRTKTKLPENFHKSVIELENIFSIDNSFETMQKLLNLYKVIKVLIIFR